MPKISVIVPCYNQAQYLDECLQSVANQIFVDWECIIVNDGSPDNTEEIAQRWIKKDSRFYYIKKENGGLSSARNAGIKIAQGDYIQFLDSDDCLHREKFAIQMNAADEATKIIISSFKLFHKSIKDAYTDNGISSEISNLQESVLYQWDNKFYIPIHTALFHRDFFQKQGILFREILKAKEDWLFWAECVLANPTFKFTPDAVAYYRKHQHSMTKKMLFMLENEQKANFEIFKLLKEHKLNEALTTRRMYIYTSLLIRRCVLLDRKKQKYRCLFTVFCYLSGVLLLGLILSFIV